MSEINCVKSYSDSGSVSDSSSTSRPSSRLPVGGNQGDSSVPGSSVTSGTYQHEEQQPSDSVFLLRSFDQYDQLDDHFDDDIDAPLSPEEQKLMREIESEQRADEELGRDVTNRAALLTSPLLMAASSEVVTSPDSAGSYFAQEAPSPEPTRVDYTIEDSNDEYDSDLDGEINEDDFQFGRRGSAMKSPPEEPPFAIEYVDPFLDDEEIARRVEKARNDRRRWIFFIIGWTLAIALVITMIVVFVTRRNDARSVPTPAPTNRPTVPPTISPRPTITPRPTELTEVPTLSPTAVPTKAERTREPSMQPIQVTSMPTPLPLTPTQPNPTPSFAPSPFPTFAPNSSPAPNPFSFQPFPLPTFDPTTPTGPTETDSPTLSPTLSDEEAERRVAITEFVILVSGVLVILDPSSPQFKAYQWILNDDPLQLMATDVPQLPQRYYLATLFYATNGDSWDECGPPTGATPCENVLQRFLSGSPECMWLGVTCGTSQKIGSINIRKNGLQGQLPPELGELSDLSTLGFSGNQLFGTIPTHLARLNRLRFLLLNGNAYKGSIPTRLGDLSSIWYLHLGNNQFSGQIPSEIFTPSIQHFDLGNNLLVGTIPAEIYTVSENLLNIDLSNNKLTGTLPTGLGDFPSLNSLSVKNNTFTGTLPGEIISDTLATLDVGNNQLNGELPPEIYMFGTSLQFVNLGINSFQGTISTSFGDLQRLETLVFFFNDLTGTVPGDLGRLTNLEVLHFAGTTLQGTMPAAVCDLRDINLQTLTSDCGGTNPILQCDCCTFCFAGGNTRNRRQLRATKSKYDLFVEP